MPIVQNILHVQGGSAQAAALFDFIADRRYGRGSVDLSRITPMPPWVYRQPTNLDLLAKYGEDMSRASIARQCIYWRWWII